MDPYKKNPECVAGSENVRCLQGCCRATLTTSKMELSAVNVVKGSETLQVLTKSISKVQR